MFLKWKRVNLNLTSEKKKSKNFFLHAECGETGELELDDF